MLQTNMAPFADLSNDELLAEVSRLATRERRATAALIRSLMELDTRRLYLAEGCSSLFGFCTKVLRLSEHAAYGRIEAARAARRFPAILDLLEDGSITLTTVTIVAAHLTPENCALVLASARHRSKREVEQLVAQLRPRSDVAASVRKLPTTAVSVTTSAAIPDAAIITTTRPAVDKRPTVEAPPAAAVVIVTQASHRPVIAPLAPERYRVQFTVSRETHDKPRHAQDLLRHTIRTGDPAEIFDRALTLLVEKLERTKYAATPRPRSSAGSSAGSRHIPAPVRREVWKRDGGRCAYIGSRGRCAEHGFLEFHHVRPFAAGGSADASNIQLRCRAHNVFEAQQFLGGFVKERPHVWDELGPDRAPGSPCEKRLLARDVRNRVSWLLPPATKGCARSIASAKIPGDRINEGY